MAVSPPAKTRRAAASPATSRRRRAVVSVLAPLSPGLLRRLLEGEGGAAEWRSRLRLITFSAGRNLSST